MTDATFNLLQLESRPNWYDHLAAVEQAVRQQEADWAIRKEYEWDGDDGGEWGPNPLQPGQDILEKDWEDTLGLPFPEDFDDKDAYVYALMETIGKYQHDPMLMAHMVAQRSAEYLGDAGRDALSRIRCQFRNSYIINNA